MPEHGTIARYHRGCHCTPCVDAKTRYNQRRDLLIATGRWQPLVDAEPVRQHVQQLRAAGLGKKRIATLAGVSPGTVQRLLFGNPASGRPRPVRLRIEVARALLAVQASLDVLAKSATVDVTGTRRRVQALMCLGWSQREQADRVGIDHRTFSAINAYDRVTASTARAIRDLYDDLSMTVAPSSQGANYARGYAKKHGYVPPLAWDDDKIDDPAARPNTGGETPPHVALLENAVELIEQGYTVRQAAERLHVDRHHLDKILQRARARARAEVAA